MSNVIILHGKPDEEEYYDESFPSCSNSHWLPWLQKQCLINDIRAHCPEVFRVYNASFEDWSAEFERYQIDEETIFVGHSCGNGFFLRWLAENKNIRIKKMILVAPWLDPFSFLEKTYNNHMFDFTLDPTVLDRVGESIIFHSDNDHASIQESLVRIRKELSLIPVKVFHNHGHFTFEEMGTVQFPELLEEILLSQ